MFSKTTNNIPLMHASINKAQKQLIISISYMDLTPKVPQSAAIISSHLLSARVVCTGELLLVVVPSPNSPFEFHPHPQSVPSVFSPKIVSADWLILDQFVSMPTCIGLLALFALFMPRAPEVPSPHVHNVPSFFIAADTVYSV